MHRRRDLAGGRKAAHVGTVRLLAWLRPPEDAVHGYEVFKHKADHGAKVVLTP